MRTSQTYQNSVRRKHRPWRPARRTWQTCSWNENKRSALNYSDGSAAAEGESTTDKSDFIQRDSSWRGSIHICADKRSTVDEEGSAASEGETTADVKSCSSNEDLQWMKDDLRPMKRNLQLTRRFWSTKGPSPSADGGAAATAGESSAGSAGHELSCLMDPNYLVLVWNLLSLSDEVIIAHLYLSACFCPPPSLFHHFPSFCRSFSLLLYLHSSQPSFSLMALSPLQSLHPYRRWEEWWKVRRRRVRFPPHASCVGTSLWALTWRQTQLRYRTSGPYGRWSTASHLSLTCIAALFGPAWGVGWGLWKGDAWTDGGGGSFSRVKISSLKWIFLQLSSYHSFLYINDYENIFHQTFGQQITMFSRK